MTKSDCTEAIARLAAGDLARWHGLPRGCTSGDVGRVLSPVTVPVNASNPVSGPVAYAPTAAAPNGLTVYYDAGIADHISIAGPRLPRPVEEMLGEPGEKMPSLLERTREQWVYPGRGLALHIDAFEPGVSWLYAFAATTREDYAASPLSTVRTLRHRV